MVEDAGQHSVILYVSNYGLKRRHTAVAQAEDGGGSGTAVVGHCCTSSCSCSRKHCTKHPDTHSHRCQHYCWHAGQAAVLVPRAGWLDSQ
jgi:hypothetical protein